MAPRDVDLAAGTDRTEGASPAYMKELLRKAAVLAAFADANGSTHDEASDIVGAFVREGLALGLLVPAD